MQYLLNRLITYLFDVLSAAFSWTNISN